MNSKIQEKAEEAYPPRLEWDYRDIAFDPNEKERTAYRRGYEAALQDFQVDILPRMNPWDSWFKHTRR